MDVSRSDALVFFGATGDLAYKKIFPALHAMVKRGHLNVPVIDAMAGDASLFAREDNVEEAWRIVDPVLKAGTPIYDYEPNSWGPREIDDRVSPVGGWHNPTLPTERRECRSDGISERIITPEIQTPA